SPQGRCAAAPQSPRTAQAASDGHNPVPAEGYRDAGALPRLAFYVDDGAVGGGQGACQGQAQSEARAVASFVAGLWLRSDVSAPPHARPRIGNRDEQGTVAIVGDGNRHAVPTARELDSVRQQVEQDLL